MPGKHFLVETDNDGAEDASSVAVEYGGFLGKPPKKQTIFCKFEALLSSPFTQGVKIKHFKCTFIIFVIVFKDDLYRSLLNSFK